MALEASSLVPLRSERCRTPTLHQLALQQSVSARPLAEPLVASFGSHHGVGIRFARGPMPGASCGATADCSADEQHKPGVFEFEEVDCQANKLNRTSSEHQRVDASAVEDLLLDSVQSPLPAIKETGEIMVKLVLMYVVLEVAAGLMKGQSPVQHLLLAGVHLKLVFQAMLAPLSMMCSGFALALVQYSLLLKKQQRASSSPPASGTAAGSKNKAE